MTPETSGSPLIRIAGLSKNYAGIRPLRIADFIVHRHEGIVLAGLDQMAAEMFVYLVTGAALPDEGHVNIGGVDTRDISTDTQWLSSLDRFGVVTHRAVLLEGLSVAANLALPMTLSIEPMADDVRGRVETMADLAGIPRARLDAPVSSLTEDEKLRTHLARAIAVGPELIMLEHPTATLDQSNESARFGETLKAMSEQRGFGWIAISEDEAFAKGSSGKRLRLDGVSGNLDVAGAKRKRWFGRE